MKAGQLARILLSVNPETEVYFSVGYDNDDRREILKAAGDPDVFSEMKAQTAEISEVSVDEFRLDISLFPEGFVPADINTFCKENAKKRAEANQGDNK